MNPGKYIPILSILIAVISCNKSGGSEEVSLEVTPPAITAPYTLNTQEVEVSSNGVWSVEVKSLEGADVNWAQPSRTQGQGNAKVSIRVFQNEFGSSRVATIIFKVDGGKTGTVTLTQEGNPASGVSDDEITVRIGTYNIRVASNSESDSNNNWDNRKERLIKSIQDNGFDVFGLNECKTSQQNYLKEQLGTEYNFQFFSPYAQSGTGDKAQGIGFKKGFSLGDWHYFWLGDNPDVLVNNDGSSNRGGCCGIITHNDTGIKFFFMVTHGPLDDSLRDNMAFLYQKMEMKYNTASYPSFFVGDMNASPSSACSITYKEYWQDTYASVSAADKSGPQSTFNGFDLNRNMYTNTSRLDYIYYRNATPTNYVCNDSKYGGYYASDHLPIYSDMKVKSVAK